MKYRHVFKCRHIWDVMIIQVFPTYQNYFKIKLYTFLIDFRELWERSSSNAQ